jgi:NAD(P)-dependent dehydrogenase (short-subunit alcohol dehydrogenase family)
MTTAGPAGGYPAADPASRRFDAQVAIVTGAASGIGRVLATALVAEGATVVLADLDGPGAERSAAEIGRGAEPAAVDVTDAGAVASLVDSVVGRYGRIDLLCNNAGIGAGGPVEQLTLADWAAVIDADLNSVVYGVAAAYPSMVRQASGHIVNTASLAGLVPSPLLTPYAAAKAAVVGLSVSLRVEAAAHGVGVSVVCPGPVETPILDQTGPGNAVNARKLLTNALGPPYPAAAMAADILDGVVENRAIIVAPATARAAWEGYRRAPEAVLDAMAAQARASRQRREGTTTDG